MGLDGSRLSCFLEKYVNFLNFVVPDNGWLLGNTNIFIKDMIFKPLQWNIDDKAVFKSFIMACYRYKIRP